MRADICIRTLLSSISIILLVATLAGLSQAKSIEQVNDSELEASRVEAQKPSAITINPQAKISHVVVKFRDQAQVRLRSKTFVSLKGKAINNALSIFDQFSGAEVRKLFNHSPESALDQTREKLQHKIKRALPDLNGYYRLEVTDPAQAEQLINELNELDIVELAYFQPTPIPAGDIEPPTPNYVAGQDYLRAAPEGIDADWANTQPGGDGSGVKIIDIENAWQHDHEDLDQALNKIIGGVPHPSISRNHGTAVLGELIATDNEYGVTGICPGAEVGMISVVFLSTAEAIYMAADSLNEGDIILIELHAPGPHYDFDPRDDQLGFVCMEYWLANYDAMLYAWAKGIIVVEAAGNGAEDFDDELIYGSLFDTTYRNSHAIIVGAGDQADSPNDLERLSFSNYGQRVNLQGYGRGVYTTGYGDLFAPNGDQYQFYTATFSGTSSASPIVAGAVACLQGHYQATYNRPLSADPIREILYATGTPQLGNVSEHIGPRPNLNAAFPLIPAPGEMHVSPGLVKGEALDGDMATASFYLVNRSLTDQFEFELIDTDSLAKLVTENWLVADPSSGAVAASDSIEIQVSMDASLIVGRADPYKGIIEINYGPSNALDSFLLVPAFFTVLCNNKDYAAFSASDLGGATYDWVSAVALGYEIPSGDYYSKGEGLDSLDDGTTGPIAIGFDFPFYGQIYNQIYVGVNGGLSFTDNHLNVNGYFSGLSIPGAPFTTLLAPYWNDLIIRDPSKSNAGIYIYKPASSDSIVIQWHQLGNFNDPGDNTCDFEIILTPDGTIKYQYFEIGSSSLEFSALIGISELECNALSYFDNNDQPEHLVYNNEAIEFSGDNLNWVQAGDANNSGLVNVSDIAYLVNYLFGVPTGPPPPVYELGNANCDPSYDINVADISYLVNYLFGVPTGPPPCYFWMAP